MNPEIIDFALKVLGGSVVAINMLKKIPVFKRYIHYEESLIKIDKKVEETQISNIKLQYDPKEQISYINQFNSEEEKKLAAIQLMEYDAGTRKRINAYEVILGAIELAEKEENISFDEKEIHQDWWMLWFETSQMTSDPDKKELLSKVLLKESQNSGSISPRFLRFIAELTYKDLRIFKKNIYKFLFKGIAITSINHIPIENKIQYEDAMELEEIGILRHVDGFGARETIRVEQYKEAEIDMFHFKIKFNREIKEILFDYREKLTMNGIQLRELLDDRQYETEIENLNNQISSTILSLKN